MQPCCRSLGSVYPGLGQAGEIKTLSAEVWVKDIGYSQQCHKPTQPVKAHPVAAPLLAQLLSVPHLESFTAVPPGHLFPSRSHPEILVLCGDSLSVQL